MTCPVGRLHAEQEPCILYPQKGVELLHRWIIPQHRHVVVVQLAIQPGLEVRTGQTVLASAVMGPLTGNSCPGDGSTPFVGCPAGFYCPTPAQQVLCPVVSP